MAEKNKKETNGLRDIAVDSSKDFLRNFHVSNEKLEKVEDNIDKNAKSSFDFILLTIASVIIIVLGIIIDSTSVVIGGMLIAPLFWPIMGFLLGLVNGKSKQITKHFLTFAKSFITIIGVATLIGLIAPNTILESNEFISRTSPTIFDLLIGLASGFLGAFIVAHPKISSSFGGVVIAAALVPPTSVVGISLAKGDFDSFGGAALLTLASLISIAFSAGFLFFIAKVQQQRSKVFIERQKEYLKWSLVILLILIVPLIFFTNEIIGQTNQKRIIDQVITSKFPNSRLTATTINETSDIYTVKLVIERKESLTDSDTQDIATAIAQEFKKSVVLNVQIIPIEEKTEIVNY